MQNSIEPKYTNYKRVMYVVISAVGKRHGPCEAAGLPLDLLQSVNISKAPVSGIMK